jgi:hypothetical protein
MLIDYHDRIFTEFFMTQHILPKQLNKLLVALFVALTIQGCAESYSAYEATRGHHGYSEQTLDDGRIMLRYYGTTRHSHEEIEVFWEHRANELCPNGFEEFSPNASPGI